ncbi:MAG: hypothetical protein IPL16_07365 [Ignavibacteria bacterium]|nr:hypothetical protein [Ignavibacteria bacterium]
MSLLIPSEKLRNSFVTPAGEAQGQLFECGVFGLLECLEYFALLAVRQVLDEFHIVFLLIQFASAGPFDKFIIADEIKTV